MDHLETPPFRHGTNISPNSKKKIAEALSQTAMMRSGKMEKDALRFYTERLSREPVEDVLAALEKLAESPRGEYEQAIPEIGAVLSLVKCLNIARLNRLEIERRKQMTTWKCPECQTTVTAWILPTDEDVRRCPGIPRNGSTRVNHLGKPVCGAVMNVI